MMQSNSDQAKQLQEQDKRIESNLARIRYRLVVFSGKGGVGKTTVAVNLSFALQKTGNKVGLLDADITGPNVPKMAGVTGQPFVDGQNMMLPMVRDGVQIISMAAMIPEAQPIIWRGPLRSGAITQFIGDVIWDDLDYLIADLPPGTGDEVLTAAQRMRPQMAVVVTTPQEMSLMDCRRAVTMAKKLNIPKIGIIENMAGLICPHCGESIDVFDSGGGSKLAQEMDVTFLGSIPLELKTRKDGDDGKPPVLEDPDSATAGAFMSISENIVNGLK